MTRRRLGDGSVEAREGEVRLVGGRDLVHCGLALDRALSLRRGCEASREGVPIAAPFATRVRRKGLADDAVRQIASLFAAQGVKRHFARGDGSEGPRQVVRRGVARGTKAHVESVLRPSDGVVDSIAVDEDLSARAPT